APAAAAALAAGEGRRHRPPAEHAAPPPRSLPPLVCPAPGGKPQATGARTGALARRLFHYVQRAGDRPGRGGRARSGGLRGGAGGGDLLLPADDQQGVPPFEPPAPPGPSAAPGPAPPPPPAAAPAGTQVPADARRRVAGTGAGARDAARRSGRRVG